eukprot:Em0014g681a
MEVISSDFVEAVRALFDSCRCVVLATIPIASTKSHWLVDELRKRDDCRLFENDIIKSPSLIIAKKWSPYHITIITVITFVHHRHHHHHRHPIITIIITIITIIIITITTITIITITIIIIITTIIIITLIITIIITITIIIIITITSIISCHLRSVDGDGTKQRDTC